MRLFQLLNMRGLAPHGYCLLWDPLLVWLHVVADAIIGLSYFSIPVVLAVFLARRRDVEFGWLIALFAVFITACGTTHFMSILVLWVPAEEQLRQSQKLDAIGQLTGGIAHDFNNILAIIVGNVDRAMRGIDNPDRALGALANAMEASQRAAGLTEQLLAFARKQPMEVQTHDLNIVVGELAKLMALTVGTQAELDLRLAEEALLVDVDRNQLEAALINLAVNARDAMPDGGRLTISTAAAGPGEVVVRVADTGTGMDAKTLERATEPFYTTKPVGRGTGLGLSQVYGFATQAGGRLDIASEPGEGTVVAITLRRRQHDQ